ncbi:aromatic acid exporter family protein [Paenibacillus pasadenensis]|uniref:Putative aromatic acid exporter C-terminal domain-containing protein n=1 Tax=Paenibacillus pasadenensis TaxID=217090 RepID=A0A2N5N0S0_9BACL|nr:MULTISPECIES: aromatic acid exporter family protein [Paenibacillus]PLT43933.1 hypothetical protein B8V81_2364 [Paenibacillus pasadenensis]QGG54509.1 aromatic acid exporter family protein [Paenibacillus sp. B01]
MRIGFRTLKTAVGVSLSVLTAQQLGLLNFASAGILTLLCIQKTRRQSFNAIWERLLACLVGIAVSGLAFELAGYYALLFVPIYLVLIPLCVGLRCTGGIASSSVIMMHVYIHGDLTLSFIGNELALIAIGLGLSLVVNLYMPGIERQVMTLRRRIEDNIERILRELAIYLKDGSSLWDGRELLELDKLLEQARALGVQATENDFSGRRSLFYTYYETRRRQADILKTMMPLVSQVDARLEQGRRIGEFLDDLADHWNTIPGGRDYHERLRSIRDYHKELPLPETREEFETRASLYGMANELERFILTLA